MELMKATWALISSWALTMASYMMSSGSSLAPASIMMTFFSVAATVKSSWDLCFCSLVGFMTIWPST